MTVIPEMDWKATMNYEKADLDLLFLPQLSVKHKDGVRNNRQGVGVSLLYVNNEPNSGETSDFTTLSRAMLAWAFNAYFSKNGGTEPDILDEKVTIDNLNAIYAYLSQDTFSSSEAPFGTEELLHYFFEKSFNSVTLNTKQETLQDNLRATDQSVAIFPMFPIFKMCVTGQEDVDFMTHGASSPEYLQAHKNVLQSDEGAV